MPLRQSLGDVAARGDVRVVVAIGPADSDSGEQEYCGRWEIEVPEVDNQLLHRSSEGHRSSESLDKAVGKARLRCPTRVNGISRLIGFLYSAASLSADRNPVW